MKFKSWIRSKIDGGLAKRGYALTRNSISGRDWQTALRIALPGDTAQGHTVLDIGAHVGSFSKMVLDVSPKAKIHAFEPIPQLADSIRALSGNHPNLHCVQLALGSVAEERELRVHAHIDSSSLLPPDESYRQLYPEHCALTGVIKVSVVRLDDWAASNGVGTRLPIDLVKMDVQGLEGEVIAGGQSTLKNTRYLITEAAFTPAYQGGIMLDELCEKLRALGFEMVFAFNVFAASADLFWQNRQLVKPTAHR